MTYKTVRTAQIFYYIYEIFAYCDGRR